MIEKYNSSYPLGYYKTGKVYSFYGQAKGNNTPANERQINEYSDSLKRILHKDNSGISNNINTDNNAGKSLLNRYYAVVVDKVLAGVNSHIVVMFCVNNNGSIEYYTKKYAVNFGCSTDDKDLMPVSSHVDINVQNSVKKGGITRVDKTVKIGGITRAEKPEYKKSSVGRITRANKG